MKFLFFISSTILFSTLVGCAKNTSIVSTNQNFSSEETEYQQIENKTINNENSINKMNRLSQTHYLITE